MEGCFVEYFDKGSRLVYIPKQGEIKNFKKDIIHAAIFSSSNGICEEVLEKVNPIITCLNDCDQVVGYMSYVDQENVYYFPFFWSPAQCNILPNLNNNSFTSFTYPVSINNYGIIVGYGLKNHERTLYLGDKKIEKKLMCHDSIPVVWPNISTIKEICLFDDKNDNLSYLGVKNGRPYHITIDDDNFIYFWFDSSMSERCGCIHLSEIE